MKLELLLLADRRPAELAADLAGLPPATEPLAVQVWLREAQEALIERTVEQLRGDARFQLFTHRGAPRGDRLIAAANQARGDLLLELPPGTRPNPEALERIAELGPDPRVVLGAEGAVAVVPEELRARVTLTGIDELEAAAALAAARLGTLVRLDVPLLSGGGRPGSEESDGARGVGAGLAMLSEARAAGDDAVLPELQLELLDGIRTWTGTRARAMLGGHRPVWRRDDP